MLNLHSDYQKEHYINLKKLINIAEQYYKLNPGKLKQAEKDNLEKAKKQYHREWYKYNYKKRREWEKQYQKNRRKIDLKYRLSLNISCAIWQSLKRRKSIKSKKGGRHWESLVGYNLTDLIYRLKKTMPVGYTWKDYLSGELHIDHIIPVSVFNFTRPEHTDFKRCWALSNLRLLPAKENLIKHNKLDRPFQPALKI